MQAETQRHCNPIFCKQILFKHTVNIQNCLQMIESFNVGIYS